MDNTNSTNLSSYIDDSKSDSQIRVVAIGEVLWDVFEDSLRLGGAPLNFAVHAARLCHRAVLISAIGSDSLGQDAREQIARLGLDQVVLQTVKGLPTGTAKVRLGDTGQPSFVIHRPAAYDGLQLSGQLLRQVQDWGPNWVYFGTLFSFTAAAKDALDALLAAIPRARRFYDMNLRADCYTAALVSDLLGKANAVKFSEHEMAIVSGGLGLPGGDAEEFCRAGSARFGWGAAAVTFGARGCAVWVRGKYAEAGGVDVQISDTVGAGDAFSAAFLHGLDRGWPPGRIAAFANQVGAIVASRPGAIPEWSPEEVRPKEFHSGRMKGSTTL